MITETGTFKYKTEPMTHQESLFSKTKDLEHYALFWEMGTGKTKVVIDTMAHLYLKGEIDGVLIICDKGGYRNWVDTEIPIHIPDNIPHRTGVWQATIGKRAYNKVSQLLYARDNCLDIVVMNVEAFSSEKASIFAEAFLESHYAMVVIDESDSIKTLSSKRTQAILKLRSQCDYRRILTGTPIANSPLDLYAQAEFLQQGLLGVSFVIFRSEYANLMLIDAGRGKRYWKIINYKNLDKLKEIIKPWSDRILKTECLDLPGKIYETVYVEHTPEQAKMYKDIKEQALTEYAGGLLTVTSAMTALTKLQQINCGHVIMNPLDDEEKGIPIEIPSNRIEVLLEVLDKTSGKVIIWANFRKDFELIGKALEENYGPESFVQYYGETKQNDRPDAIKRFREDQSCRFFVSNPATGGRSITLVEADYAIYYSYSWRLALRLQSEDRNYRKGQTKPCVYVDLCTPSTVDVKIRKSHQMKKDLASTILSDFSQVLDDEES